MNDEIREILENCEKAINEASGYNNTTNKIIDYITNLEQANEEWAMIFDTFSKRPYAHKYLEEKRKELGNDKIIGLDSEMIYKDYYDYKSRVEKADEYIDKQKKKMYKSRNKIALFILMKLENILQNGSEDNE